MWFLNDCTWGKAEPQRCHAAYYTALLTLCMCARMCATKRTARPAHTNPSGLEMGHRFCRYLGVFRPRLSRPKKPPVCFHRQRWLSHDDESSRGKKTHHFRWTRNLLYCNQVAAERGFSPNRAGRMSEWLSRDVKIHRPILHDGTDHSSRCAKLKRLGRTNAAQPLFPLLSDAKISRRRRGK